MTAYIAPSLSTLTDGPGPLTEADRGKFLLWDGRKVDVARIEMRGGAVIVGGGSGGGTSTIAGATDFSATLGVGTDGYAIVWDNDAQAFTLATFEAAGAAAAAVLAHAGASDPHEGYLLASGARAGATAGLQAFTSGVVTGVIRPPSDSTTAVRVQNAAGSSDALIINTLTNSVGVGTFAAGPSSPLHVSIDGVANLRFDAASDTATIAPEFLFTRNRGTIASRSAVQDGDVLATMIMRAWSGTGNRQTIVISGEVDGTVSGSFVPGRLILKTGSTVATATERLRIDSIGQQIATIASADTTTVRNLTSYTHTSSGTPAAGFGAAIRVGLKSSTTANQNAGRLIYEWVTATHASRASRGKLTAYGIVSTVETEQEFMRWEGDGGGVKGSFYGVAAVARAAAYTQTYSTATRTLPAYTSDPETSAYTGEDLSAVGGTGVAAYVSDLNALRVAYETLRAHAEATSQVLNSVIDDLQAVGLLQ